MSQRNILEGTPRCGATLQCPPERPSVHVPNSTSIGRCCPGLRPRPRRLIHCSRTHCSEGSPSRDHRGHERGDQGATARAAALASSTAPLLDHGSCTPMATPEHTHSACPRVLGLWPPGPLFRHRASAFGARCATPPRAAPPREAPAGNPDSAQACGAPSPCIADTGTALLPPTRISYIDCRTGCCECHVPAAGAEHPSLHDTVVTKV